MNHGARKGAGIKGVSVTWLILLALFSIHCAGNTVRIEQADSCGCARVQSAGPYPDFITASRDLDLSAMNRLATNEAQRQYLDALRLLIEGKTTPAGEMLFKLAGDPTDQAVRAEAELVLETLLLAEEKWNDFLKIHSRPESNVDVYFSHAKAWSISSPTEFVFPSDGVTVPLSYTRNGQPLVRVFINDRTYLFILDTGAQFSMISKEVARDCGIKAVAVDGIDSRSMISLPGVIPAISIGKAEIRNLPVMIAESKEMDLDLFGLCRLMKIDGIIGWPQLRRLRLEFDDFGKTLHLSPGRQAATADGDFFFYLRPLVKAIASNGVVLFLFFDSGKGYTSLFAKGATKTAVAPSPGGISVSSTPSLMGGTTVQRRTTLKEAGFCINGFLCVFDELPVEGENPFFDGWLGMDVGKGKKLIVDFSSKTFAIQEPR